MKKVEPRLSRGLRDILPQEMLARQQMIDVIRRVYESYGFSPLDTPAVEFLDVLSGSAGQEAQQSIFRVTNPEEEDLGLRFDLTVPLSRVVSQYNQDIEFPFRRYQVSPVWRADKPAPGRFRQFTQFDIDSVGAPSEIADVEIMAAMCDTLEALQVGRYIVRFSSRKILNLLLAYAGISEEQGVDVFRVLDKLDKIGMAKVRLELTTGYKDESGDTIRGVGLESEQVDKIEAFLATKGETRAEVIAKVRELFAGVEGAEAELDVIQTISEHLEALGYSSDRVMLDLSIARGLAYYTGPVFEANLLDAPEFGSVFGGGRYDNLVTRFGGQPIPATGASIGVDRLLAALVHLGRVKTPHTTAQVLVTAMDGSLMREYLELAFELRRAGIRTEIHVGRPKKLGKQLQRADRLQIPYVLIMGGDEAARGVVTVKEMDIGREQAEQVGSHEEWKAARFGQQEVPRTELVATLRRLLSA
ncbi:MAG: histidine--tRNA ligase [Bryobacterales bacterium]|nr:histidine--tRNA ligase [Bryobacterales bacterium]